MKQPQIIILGANGMLGSMLRFVSEKKQIDTTCLTRQDFDALIDPIEKLNNYINHKHQYCVIVNCIGAIPQKKYSTDEYYNLNTVFPHQLAEYCKKNKIHLIHISTNCVFSGKKDKYIETDIPDAEDDYGKTKYLGEPSDALVIRCSIIGLEINSSSQNNSYGLLEWFLNSSHSVNGYVDSIWNGITTFELANIIFERIQNNKLEYKLVHYYSEYSYSKFELLVYINVLFEKRKEIIPIEKGIKYYTLSSAETTPRKDILEQLDDLYHIYLEYKQFFNL